MDILEKYKYEYLKFIIFILPLLSLSHIPISYGYSLVSNNIDIEDKISQVDTHKQENSETDGQKDQCNTEECPPPAKCIKIIIEEAKSFYAQKKEVIPKKVPNNKIIYVDIKTRYLYVFNNEFTPLLTEIPVGIGRGGIGSKHNSNQTPTGAFNGKFEVSSCKGCTLRIKKNVPMITTAAIWMHGLEKTNLNSFKRGIGIHAYPGDWLAKKRGNSSWGCIVTTDDDMWRIVEKLKPKTNDSILVLVNDIH